ncbi:MAG: hypothetical protein JNL21_18840 [Myxococcales bacterium]|nr:hypothetical protein [Myxococcales bacterium]
MRGSWLPLAMFLACTSNGGGDDCPVASEDCPCTDGGSCDDGLVCEDDVCRSEGQGAGSAALCETSCGAAVSRCDLTDSDRQACVEDCEARQAAQPEDCRDEWDAGLQCQSSESAWSCSDGHAVATNCEAERVAQEGCIWNGGYCDELGGSLTTAGACFVECTADADCPLDILGCPAAGTVWATAYCAVDYAHQDQLGCGPAGWRESSVIGGCALVCSGEGNDSECPPQMHCVADSLAAGSFFCTGVGG